MAGLDNATGEYVFDSDWKLVSFKYFFGSGSLIDQKPRNEMLSDYEYINKALIEKYGSPITGVSPFTSDGFQDDITFLNTQKGAQLLRLNEWLFKMASGGYVKIEHWASVIGLDSIGYEATSHYLQYSYLSDNYVDFISDALNNKENQTDNDL
jgi:hypothetical protein